MTLASILNAGTMTGQPPKVTELSTISLIIMLLWTEGIFCARAEGLKQLVDPTETDYFLP